MGFTITSIVENQDNQIEFQIIEVKDGYAIKSCIDESYYVDNLILPDRDYSNQRVIAKFSEGKILAIEGGYWDRDDCLIVPVESISKDVLMMYVMQMTHLKAEEIQFNRTF